MITGRGRPRPATATLVAVLAAGVVAVAASALITREAFAAAGGGTTGRGLALAVVRLAAASVLTLPAWRRTGSVEQSAASRGDAGSGPSTSSRDDARSASSSKGVGRSSAAPSGALPPGTRARTVTAGALLGVHFATWLPSLAFTSIAASTTIVTSGPVWVVLLLWIVKGQRPTAATLVGVGVAMAGGVVLALGEGEGSAGSDPLLGNLLALVAAITYAGHLLLGQSVQARGLGLWRWTAVVAGVGAVTVLPLAVVVGVDGPVPASFWLWGLSLTLAPQLVGHSAFTWSVRWLSPTLVSVVILFEPVLASLGGAVLYDEVPGVAVVVGAVVLVVGVGLTVLAERRPAPPPAPAA